MRTPYQVVERNTLDLLGEGPLWSSRRNTLFWVDILAPALQSYDMNTGTVSRWEMPEPIGWIVERKNGLGFVIGLKSGFAKLSLDPFDIERIGNPEPDRPQNRLNDAAIDRVGRIWAGSKNDGDDAAPTGALYRLDSDFSWSRHDDGYQVTNGPTFSSDGMTLFHTDTMNRTVFAFDLADDGSLRNKRLFLQFETSWGYPDGMCTDAEGGVWIAHWGGGRISRFTPEGKLDRDIALPASQITSCSFAGEKLERMFVTSARIGITDEPLAGALFEVEPQVRGMECKLFAG